MVCGTKGHWVALGSRPLLPICYPKATRYYSRGISLKLTDRSIAALTLPEGETDLVVFDDAMPGFGIRLRPGSKRYHVQCRAFGRQPKKSLGDVRKMTLDQARAAARQWFAQIALGIDPAAEEATARAASAAAALTLGVAAARYLDYKKNRLSRSSFNSAQRHFEKHLAPLTTRPLAEIKRADVAAQLLTIIEQRGPIAAARARSTLSDCFAWSMGAGLCEQNPVLGTIDPEEGVKSRDRVLTDRELAAVWNASAAADDFDKIVRLLILTGCRRDEIGSLRWSEIDLNAGTLTIPAERSKNRRAHCLILPPMALNILKSIPRRADRDYVFGWRGTGFQRYSARTNALRTRLPASMPVWTLHDLRRTMRTGLGKLGIPSHVAELAINHTRQGIQGVYDRHTYEREIGHALTLWADHVAAIIDGRITNVVPLKRA